MRFIIKQLDRYQQHLKVRFNHISDWSSPKAIRIAKTFSIVEQVKIFLSRRKIWSSLKK